MGLRAQNDAKYVLGLVNIDSFTRFKTKGSAVLTAQDTLDPVLNKAGHINKLYR
jgi:hypothetical protein